MNAALRIFQQYSDVANITFTVVDDPAEADVVMVNWDRGFLNGVEIAGGFLGPGPTEIDGVTYNTAVLELFLGAPGMTDGDFAPRDLRLLYTLSRDQ